LEGLSESIAKELDPAWNIKVGLDTKFVSRYLSVITLCTLQITLAELGFYRTNFVKNHTYTVYSHPSYEFNPDLIGSQTRAMLGNIDPSMIKGDPDKLAKRLFELAALEDPPTRILLGVEGPALWGPKLEVDEKEREKYQGWSDGLSFDE
jgi:hypothetical protein